MKKILLLLFIFISSIQMLMAKDYSLNFNGEKYYLLYSAKNKEFGGYINEYFKKGETYNIWSEMVAVHHFPNAYSPIDRIKDFKDYLGSMHVPSSLTFDDKKNTATIDFILIAEQNMPVVMEFNVFKYEKSKKSGSIAVQYVKRYSATTTLQIEQIKSDFEKNRKKLVKKVQKLEIPEVIDESIDKCISALDIKNETDNEIRKEKEALVEQEKKLAEEIADGKEDVHNNTKEILKETDIVNTTDVDSLKQENMQKENNKTSENNEEILNSKNNDAVQKAEVVLNPSTTDGVAQKTEEKKNDDKAEEKEKILDSVTNDKQVKAPVPNVEETKVADKKEDKKSKKHKKVKEITYQVANSKDSYISQPRTKKELKAEVKAKRSKFKQEQKEAKKRLKLEKKQKKQENKLLKEQAKIDKKNKKIQEKMDKKPYEFSNVNSELRAKPRTKKELKKQTKQNRKQAKERAKKAKKVLSE